MPCYDSRSGAPDLQGLRLQEVCDCLIYALTALGKKIPEWIRECAKHSYCRGQEALDVATDRLCRLCREMDEQQAKEVIYNAYSRPSRRLADWWEEHQELDKQRDD